VRTADTGVRRGVVSDQNTAVSISAGTSTSAAEVLVRTTVRRSPATVKSADAARFPLEPLKRVADAGAAMRAIARIATIARILVFMMFLLVYLRKDYYQLAFALAVFHLS
jgi:hypothetical protein